MKLKGLCKGSYYVKKKISLVSQVNLNTKKKISFKSMETLCGLLFLFSFSNNTCRLLSCFSSWVYILARGERESKAGGRLALLIKKCRVSGNSWGWPIQTTHYGNSNCWEEVHSGVAIIFQRILMIHYRYTIIKIVRVYKDVIVLIMDCGNFIMVTGSHRDKFLYIKQCSTSSSEYNLFNIDGTYCFSGNFLATFGINFGGIFSHLIYFSFFLLYASKHADDN